MIAGLAHDDVNTILGHGLRNHCKEPFLGEDGKVVFRDATPVSGDENVLRPGTMPLRRRSAPPGRRPPP